MSRENVETVRQVYETVNARLEFPPELFGQDFESDASDVAPDSSEVVRGLDATQAGLRGYWEMFDGYHTEIEEVISADEKHVVTAFRDGGKPRGGDAEVWAHLFHVWTLRDGMIIRLSIHTARNRALEAAGLSE